VLEPSLDVSDGLTGVMFKPTPIQIFSGAIKLNEEVTRKILRFDLPPLFAVQSHEQSLVIAHDDPGI